MYESPIEIIQKDIVMKQENDIYQAILEQGIVVDKEELIRALQYDRGQYEKGYRDGKAASPEIVRCKDCKYFTTSRYHTGETYTGCTNWGTCNIEPCNENDFCSYGERRTDNGTSSDG